MRTLGQNVAGISPNGNQLKKSVKFWRIIWHQHYCSLIWCDCKLRAADDSNEGGLTWPPNIWPHWQMPESSNVELQHSQCSPNILLFGKRSPCSPSVLPKFWKCSKSPRLLGEPGIRPQIPKLLLLSTSIHPDVANYSPGSPNVR